MKPPDLDWTTRPTLHQVRKAISVAESQWRELQHHNRWQRRLGRAPWYNLGLLLLLILGVAVLLVGTFILWPAQAPA